MKLTRQYLTSQQKVEQILFVGTKKQAQDAIKTEAERCGMYYVNERWLGGMLTNFKTIQSRIARLKEIEAMSEDGTFDVLPKKEVIEIKKEWEKLEKNLGGIKEMKRIPDAIFVVDPKKERICVQEAHTLGIPLIGIADTNCDPEELDYVIPGNDDAIRAVKLIVSKMADAVIEANQGEAEEVYEGEDVETARRNNRRIIRTIQKIILKDGGKNHGNHSKHGKRIKRNDRRWYDGLQKSSERI